jgi:hypothetical protein
MPLVEVVGSAASAAPEQIAAIGLNVGVTAAFIIMVFVLEVAPQPPAAAIALVTI